jgi:hypothetical protein
MKAKDKSRIAAAGMRFMRQTGMFTQVDFERNADILKELRTEPILDEISKYKNDEIQHVNRKTEAGMLHGAKCESIWLQNFASWAKVARLQGKSYEF